MRAAVVIVLSWLAVRLALFPLIDWQADLYGGDSRFYWEQSANIGGGLRPPGYALFLAALQLPWLVVAVQSLITLGMAIAAYKATRSLLAGCLIAACPFFVFLEARILSEILYGALVFFAFLILYRFRSIGAGAVAGVLLGLAILTRDTFALLPLFVLFFRVGRQGLAMVAAAYLIGSLALIDSSGADRAKIALWIGTWERSPEWTKHISSEQTFPDYAYRSPSEKAAIEKAIWTNDGTPFEASTIQRYQTEPFTVLSSWALRYPYLWLGTRSDLSTLKVEGLAWYALKSVLWGLNLVILVLGIAGLGRNRLFAIPIAYVALIYIPFHNTETRYSLVAMPFLCVLMSGSIHALVNTSAAVRLGSTCRWWRRRTADRRHP